MKKISKYPLTQLSLKYLTLGFVSICGFNPVYAESVLLDENAIKNVIESGFSPQRWVAPDWPTYKWPTGTNRWVAGEAVLDINSDESGSMAEIIGKIDYSAADSVYFGKNTLENNLDTSQKLTTSSYTKSINNSVTTSTTKGWKIGSKVSVKGGVSIPFVSKGEVAVEVSGEYNSSSTNSETTTISETYTIPPQTIELKPHEKVVVSVYLAQAQASGKYRSYQYASGMAFVPFRSFTDRNIPSYWQSSNSIYTYLKYSSYLPANLIGITDEQTKKIKVFSEGTFMAKAGVEFNVVITPIDRSSGRLLNSSARVMTVRPVLVKKNSTGGSGIRFW